MWLQILLKMKPNEKYENLKFCENLQICLEILLKIKPNEKYENLKFCEKLKIWLEILLNIFLLAIYPNF